MTTHKFQKCYAETLKWEGAGCHVAPGEDWETCWGIAEKFNRDLWADGRPTREQCFERAFTHYWMPSGAEDMPLALALTHFDFTFNAGNGAARSTFDEIDDDNMAAVGIEIGQQGFVYADDDYTQYAHFRGRFYTDPARRNRDLNLPGWINRTMHMLETGRAWAGEAPEKADIAVLNHFEVSLPGGFWQRLSAALSGRLKGTIHRLEGPVWYRETVSTQDRRKVVLHLSQRPPSS